MLSELGQGQVLNGFFGPNWCQKRKMNIFFFFALVQILNFSTGGVKKKIHIFRVILFSVFF